MAYIVPEGFMLHYPRDEYVRTERGLEFVKAEIRRCAVSSAAKRRRIQKAMFALKRGARRKD